MIPADPLTPQDRERLRALGWRYKLQGGEYGGVAWPRRQAEQLIFQLWRRERGDFADDGRVAQWSEERS